MIQNYCLEIYDLAGNKTNAQINKKINKYVSRTGSTRSQLLYLLIKSSDMTWPQTDVILKKTGSWRNVPCHSCTEQAPFTAGK